MRHAFLAAGFVAAVLLSTSALAQMPGTNLAPPPAMPRDLQPQTPLITAAPIAVDERVAFNSSERWIIPTFYERVREKQHRAGRSKKYERTLPAGITAAPARGDLLPRTVLATLDRLPGPLLRSLPPARPETDRVMVGKDILMVSTSTGEVLDVLPDVLH
jgi:hypothetical protein